MIKCYNCGIKVHVDEVHTAFDEVYCEHCFDELFTNCERCGTTLATYSTYYDDDGTTLCQDCYLETTDPEAPDNPSIDEADRRLIISMSREWLFYKNVLSPIKINPIDLYLEQIKDSVGLVKNPVYLYGLADRDAYQISATNDIKQTVISFFGYHLQDIKVVEESGSRKLGVSLYLRENHFKLITTIVEKICAE